MNAAWVAFEVVVGRRPEKSWLGILTWTGEYMGVNPKIGYFLPQNLDGENFHGSKPYVFFHGT